MKKQCETKRCKNIARFYVSQSVMPQVLGNGDKESSPAARSNLSCGKHLPRTVKALGSLSYRTNDSVQITLQ